MTCSGSGPRRLGRSLPRVALLAMSWALVCLPSGVAAGDAAAPPTDEAAADAGSAPAGENGSDEASRLGEWRRRREAKLGHGEPYHAGSLERLMLKGDKGQIPNLYGWNVWGFYPRLQSIAAGSKTALGVRFWRPRIGKSGVDVHGSAFYSLASYKYYDLQVGRIPNAAGALPLRAPNGDDLYELADLRPKEGGLILYGSFQYRDYTELDFYGLGPDSQDEEVLSYRLKGPVVELVAGYQWGPHVALSGRGGYLKPEAHLNREEGEPSPPVVLDDAETPGLDLEPDYLYGNAQLLLDFRDVPGNPMKGAMLALQYGHYDDRNLGRFTFDRFVVDARGYLPLGSRVRTLAVRAFANWDETASGNRVPFYLQEHLGGPQTLRGFSNFRFRGEKVLLLQAEYRWEPAAILEAAFFVDSGTVAREDGKLDLDDLKTDWGFGLRFKSWRSVFLRLEVANGDEGTRFVFATHAAF